jgi:hypothetical protein
MVVSLLAACSGSDPADMPASASAGQGGAMDADDAGADLPAQPQPQGDCEVTSPTGCPDPPLRYADVEPLFLERCVGCHNGMDGHWPLSSYQHVADWYAEIRGQMLACTMPPPGSGVTLTRAERERILVWIRCGLPR